MGRLTTRRLQVSQLLWCQKEALDGCAGRMGGEFWGSARNCKQTQRLTCQMRRRGHVCLSIPPPLVLCARRHRISRALSMTRRKKPSPFGAGIPLSTLSELPWSTNHAYSRLYVRPAQKGYHIHTRHLSQGRPWGACDSGLQMFLS